MEHLLSFSIAFKTCERHLELPVLNMNGWITDVGPTDATSSIYGCALCAHLPYTWWSPVRQLTGLEAR